MFSNTIQSKSLFKLSGLAIFSVITSVADVMRHQLIQVAILSHADNELWSVASDLLDGSHHIHFLFMCQLVNGVSRTAEQTTLLYAVPSGNKQHSFQTSPDYGHCYAWPMISLYFKLKRYELS